MKYKLIVLALLALSSAAFAAELPTAGSQLKQIPAASAPDTVAPQFRIEQDKAPTAQSADNATLIVNSLHVTNAHVFSEMELLAATGFKPGSELSLSALRGFAAQIASYYHRHGYFLAQATIPAQDIVDGAVTITIVEGQYGKIVLRNQSTLADVVAQQLLDGLNSGDAITIAPLESRLLQLADLPGVIVKSTLAPGASVGASDLIVDVAPGQRLSGSLDADNSGSRYTGAYRVGGTLNANNLLGRGDVATLRALTSWQGLNYGRAAYQLQFGKAQVGVAYTALDYELGRDFESLEAHGTAHIGSLYGRYPLIRSRTNNLYTQINFDAKTFRDKVDVTVPATISDKQAKVGLLSVVGDHRDRFGGGGLSSYSLTWSAGSLELQSPQALSTDALTARSNGHYDKLSINAMRLQSVTESLAMYAALQGQVSSRNLDVSEKMGLGGANAVRAYPEGEAYVDQGYVLNVEARMLLPKFAHLPGQLQWVVFIDSGTGSPNKNPWSAGQNRRTLSGGGLGLSWFEARGFMVKVAYAHKLGNAVATSAPDADGRFWINATKYF